MNTVNQIHYMHSLFEDDLKRRRNTYKPKLKVTLEHKNEVGRLFKDILSKAMEEHENS